MSIKASLSKPFSKLIVYQIKKWSSKPVHSQQKVFKKLIAQAQNTTFGKDHRFDKISSYQDFKDNVPVRDYEEIKGYIEQIIEGKSDVLWKGKPIYFCKSSGTTSGIKYIPITSDSISNHIDSARNALLCYINETGITKFIDGKMIFLQGSPELDEIGGIPLGRLSGIVAHHVPSYLMKNRLPSMPTNMIDNWDTKVKEIVDETVDQNMTLIGGIPSWIQMYFERLKEKSGKELIKDIFPNFSVFVFGGVDYKPYQSLLNDLIGIKIPTIELYPASEGFIAYQDSQKEEGMLLNLDSGIFFEFIKADDFFKDDRKRLSIEDVKLGVNYALVLSSNAGLWAYSIGDTIRFVNTNPYRIIVTGRIKHFISAFGEHVIGGEVEKAISKACAETKAEIIEFSVAPMVNPKEGLPYHEWFVEFRKEPSDINKFKSILDESMQEQNIYYKDLIVGSILRPLLLTRVQTNGFTNYMASLGKLGGQNKISRLVNDRSVADKLIKYILQD
ncbi:MAG: GH3 auxin-responsive promoter family protein [Flavobacteriales bacterium]|nr:GH3 auxin-responsive promoter family protein [Flavobacteriales bacterium]